MGIHGRSSGETINNSFFSALAAPQLFNPDAAGVTNDTDDFTLSSSNGVGLVTHNGQTLDDSEYSLVSAVLTVAPDNGFNATSDEVLVFQETFAFVLASRVTRVTTTQTIGNNFHQWNGNTDGGAITLTMSVGVQGEGYKLANTGTAGNLLTVAPNGAEHLLGVNSNFTLVDGESLELAYDSTDGWY